MTTARLRFALTGSAGALYASGVGAAGAAPTAVPQFRQNRSPSLNLFPQFLQNIANPHNP
jgi:hypothetical protein